MATTFNSGGQSTSHQRPIERVLEDAQYTGEINLSGRKLREYPKLSTKYDLADTSVADLSKNRLGEVPTEICEYRSLDRLNCYHNVIKILPEALTQLQNLTHLCISRNQLTVIPSFIKQLHALEVLIASHNRIVSLPEEIGELKRLMEIDVSCNEISHLPVQIGDLKSLRSLNVRRNLLVELPLEISKLHLRKLDFASNKIAVIPTIFRKLETLEEFILDHNPLTLPPAFVCTKGKQHIMKYLQIEAIKEDRKRGILNDTEMKRLVRKSLPPQNSISSEEFRNMIDNTSPENKWKRHTVLSSDSGYSTTDSIEKCGVWSPSEELQRQKSDYERKKKQAEQIRLQQEEEDKENRRLAAQRVQEAQQAEIAKQREELRLQEEARIREEERSKEEARRLEEERLREEARIAEEQRQKEDAKRQAESNTPSRSIPVLQRKTVSGTMNGKSPSSPGISPSPSPRSSVGSTGPSPASSTSSLHKTGVNTTSVVRRTKVTDRVATAPSSRTTPGSERHGRAATGSSTGAPSSARTPTTNSTSGPGRKNHLTPEEEYRQKHPGMRSGQPASNDRPPVGRLEDSRLKSTQKDTVNNFVTRKPALSEEERKRSLTSTARTTNYNNRRSGGVMSSSSTMKVIDSYKDSESNYTLRRQEEKLKEEADQLDRLRKTIESKLKVTLPDNLPETLRDGVLLCQLANSIRPRAVTSIHVPSPAVPKLTMAKCRKNVENFLEACRKIGVQRDHLCTCEDITDNLRLNRVANTVQQLALCPRLTPKDFHVANFCIFVFLLTCIGLIVRPV